MPDFLTPAAGNFEVLAVDGGDEVMSLAGRGEGRPGGSIARELRELRRFHAPVALPAGHRGHGLAVGEEGDGAKLSGRSASCGALPWPIVGAGSLRRSFSENLAAPAELRQTAARRRAAAPDEVLRVADDRAVAARVWVLEDETAASLARMVVLFCRTARPPVWVRTAHRAVKLAHFIMTPASRPATPVPYAPVPEPVTAPKLAQPVKVSEAE